ncbi:MAG: hypothetical protein ACRCYY_08275 [Trueperaceae bacterium]
MKFPFLLFALYFSLFTSYASAQTLCQSWSETRAGNLDTTFLSEASGMAASGLVTDRLYHTNDTWFPSPVLYLTDTAGQNLQAVALEGFEHNPRLDDIEDMDVGRCGDRSCLFIGDIGDNRSNRRDIRIFVVEEFDVVPSSLTPQQILNVQYPDGPHDAESLAVHPNGDIYMLTKEIASVLGTGASRLYKLPYEVWTTAGEEVVTLEFVGKIDLFALSGTTVNLFNHIATSMDISDDGGRLLILTYGEVFEIAVDVSQLSGETIATETPNEQIEVVTLLQQESISYSKGGKSFFYTAEARSGGAPLMVEICNE